jgi:hypothetical protein
MNGWVNVPYRPAFRLSASAISRYGVTNSAPSPSTSSGRRPTRLADPAILNAADSQALDIYKGAVLYMDFVRRRLVAGGTGPQSDIAPSSRNFVRSRQAMHGKGRDDSVVQVPGDLIRRFKGDLAKAGIPFRNDSEWVADFHP